MKPSLAEIKKIAEQLADYYIKLGDYYLELARINRGIEDGIFDVYKVEFPQHPGALPVEPIVWVMADGSTIPAGRAVGEIC